MFERQRRDSKYSSEDEADLIRALARGSEDAMATLYDLHGGMIYRFALRMIQDESIAEEVTQDVFLALLRQSDRFDPAIGKLSTWLCGIARRLVWKQLERTQRLESMDGAEDVPEQSMEDDPASLLTRKEIIMAVQRGIEALPPDLKEVLVLCEFEEMKYEDAAIAIGVPIGTIRSRMHRAKQKLATLLREESIRSRKP